MNADGTTPVKLTSSGNVLGDARRPSRRAFARVVPDGTKIAYISLQLLHLDDERRRHEPAGGVHAAGEHDRPLPRWSPDGTRILFNDVVGGALWTVKTDGTNVVRVLQEPDSTATEGPVWRNNGTVPATRHGRPHALGLGDGGRETGREQRGLVADRR